MYAINKLAYLADHKFKSLVNRFVRGVPNRADAEDIVQMAFLNALQHLDKNPDTLDNEEEFDKWFNTVLSNARARWGRDQHRRGMTLPVFQSAEGVVKDYVDDKQAAVLMLGEIKSLRPGFKRDVLYRRFCMNLPIVDIARIMECDVERVRKCIMRWKNDIMTRYGVSLT